MARLSQMGCFDLLALTGSPWHNLHPLAGMSRPYVPPVPPTCRTPGVTPQQTDRPVSHQLAFLNDMFGAEVPMAESD